MGAVAPTAAGRRVFSDTERRLGILWVCVSLPGVTVLSAFATTPDAYVFALVFLASGAYTAPAVLVGWRAVRRAPPLDKWPHRLFYAGLLAVFAIGVAMLVGIVTGWTWANPAGLPAVAVAGLLHWVALGTLVRTRSGRRAMSVDVVESLSAVVALTAPLVVVWGPAVAGAEASWFTVPCAATVIFTIAGAYWTALVLVRQGAGAGVVEACAVVMSLVGTVNVGVQTAQGVSGFALPAPPLVALHAVSMSMYLLIPLYAPVMRRPRLDELPPQAQVRGGRLATVIALGGVAALLVATSVVAGERPWAVPFALGTVTLLFVLAGVRHIVTVGETRRLYHQVEEVSDERRRLLGQLLDRTLHDRRRFAGQLHEQAVAAYASFAALADFRGGGGPLRSAAADASALVGDELGRHADSLRDLMRAMRSPEGDREQLRQVGVPVAAYLASLYGDDRAPRLTIAVADDVSLDWVAETVLVQIVQEALHNVWRHSGAGAVEVAVESAGDTVCLRVADDGDGFDAAAAVSPERPGIAAMRAAAAVLGGTVTVESRPGVGTTVTARLGATVPEPPPRPGLAGPRFPGLRLVKGEGEPG